MVTAADVADPSSYPAPDAGGASAAVKCSRGGSISSSSLIRISKAAAVSPAAILISPLPPSKSVESASAVAVSASGPSTQATVTGTAGAGESTMSRVTALPSAASAAVVVSETTGGAGELTEKPCVASRPPGHAPSP